MSVNNSWLVCDCRNNLACAGWCCLVRCTLHAEDELALQKVVWVITAGHAVTAGLSAKVALQRGQAWALPAAKVRGYIHMLCTMVCR